jgi:hypothetical protein
MLAASLENANGALKHVEARRLVMQRQIRRVLFFGKNMSRTRCTGALVDGLRRNGLEVLWQNYATVRRWLKPSPVARSWVRRTFERFRPDLIMVFCRDLPLELLQEFRASAPVVLWVEEALHDLKPEHLHYFAQADLVCVSNPSRIPWLRQSGVRTATFLMSGFSPRYHFPEASLAPERDVVFIGGPGVRGQRAIFLAEVARHFQTHIFGPGWREWVRRFPHLKVGPPVKAPRFRQLCATSRIVLGLNQFNEDNLYFSNRTWLSLACRAFHLTHYVPGLETVVDDGVHLSWYRDVDECLSKIEASLADDERRGQIAHAGCTLAHERHQYFHRVQQILQLIGQEAPAEAPHVNGTARLTPMIPGDRPSVAL